MRLNLLLFLFLGFYQMGLAQYNCIGTIPDSVSLAFRADAEQMALNYIYDNDLPDQQSAVIAPELIHTPYAALSALYLDTSLPHWEEVFEQYSLHTEEKIPARKIELTLDTTTQWVQNWLKNPNQEFGLGSSIFGIMQSYNFEVFDKLKWEVNENTGVAHLKINILSEKGLNLQALIPTFQQIEGVLLATPQMFFDNHFSDITYTQFDDHVELVFKYSWDCTDNVCDNHHFWSFRVYEDCTTEFVDNFGEILPVYEVLTFLSTGVFPNPTSDLVSLVALGPPNKDILVQLYGPQGQIIQQQYIQTNTGLVELDFSLANLPVGLYFLGLSTNGTVLTEKILKR